MTKIESIEVVPTTLPDIFGEQMHLCLVRVEADGVVGWGEICDSYCCTFPEVYAPLVDHVYAPLVLGSELVSVDALTRKLRMWARRRIGDAGLAIQALSGLELALWDLHGKLAGQSVSQLIGQTRDRIPVYASGKFLDEPIDMHVRILAPAIDHGVAVGQGADLARSRCRSGRPAPAARRAPAVAVADGRRERELLGHHRAPPRRRTGRRGGHVLRGARAAALPARRGQRRQPFAAADRLRRAPLRGGRVRRRPGRRLAAHRATRPVHRRWPVGVPPDRGRSPRPTACP